jgi:hypothetical protein
MLIKCAFVGQKTLKQTSYCINRLIFKLKQVHERRKQRRVAEVRLLANKKRLYCELQAV